MIPRLEDAPALDRALGPSGDRAGWPSRGAREGRRVESLAGNQFSGRAFAGRVRGPHLDLHGRGLAGRATRSPALLGLLRGGSLWRPFGVRAGWLSLREGVIDIDVLMVLAAVGAALVGAPLEGATLLFLFSLSNALQSFAFSRTRRAIQALMKLRPDRALARRDGAWISLPIEQLAIGDRVLVRPGEQIPLDGAVVEGDSAVDESSLTGESMPVMKRKGEQVIAGTMNQSGGLEIRVSRLARDSTIEKLIRMVEEAHSAKAETQLFLDRTGQVYAIGVILFTVALVLFPYFILHEPFRAVFYRAMTVMVVASPCALIISTPASILSAVGGAAPRGVLFKGGAQLERTAAVKVVAFDKTGTLTEGRPRVVGVISADAAALEEVIEAAAAVEARSEHPLARAIVETAKARGLAVPECRDFQSVPGSGANGHRRWAPLRGRQHALLYGRQNHLARSSSDLDGRSPESRSNLRRCRRGGRTHAKQV